MHFRLGHLLPSRVASLSTDLGPGGQPHHHRPAVGRNAEGQFKAVTPPPPVAATKATGFAEGTSKVVEAETTPTKLVYDNPGGSRTAKISVVPQRFKDGSGKWVDSI